MSTKKLNMLILVSALLWAGSCGTSQDDQTESGSSVTVSAAHATLQEYPKSYQFSGTVKGERQINLSTKVMGEITELSAEPGDPVTQGQVLVRIRDDQIRAQRNQVEANLAEARASLKNTKTNYKRIKALYEDSSATQKELDDISTRLEVAKSRVAALEGSLDEVLDMLDYTQIESPINGYVVGQQVEEGDLASPGQPLVRVENVDRLEIMATVPESRIGLFAVGDTARITVPAADRSFSAAVSAVNPSADQMSRQFEVTLRVPDRAAERNLVKPGMYVRVSLEKGSDPMLTVPKSALIRRGQLTGLFTINEANELVLRWVRTGRERSDGIEILAGLREGEQYVTSYEQKLEEGQKVTIQ